MIELYDYQKAAFVAIKDAFKLENRALVVMATGLGKTYVAAYWSRGEIKRGDKGLVLCDNTDILKQDMNEFREILGNKVSLRTFYGNGNKDWRADEADILFASFDILGQHNWRKVFFEDEFDFIIVDESHHSQASTYKIVLDYFTPKKLLGLTATPDRSDGREIREIFGNEIVEYPLEEAIVNDWLSPVEYHVVSDSFSHWKLKKLTQDILEKGRRVSKKQLNETIFIEARDEEIAKIIQDYCGQNRKALIFCEKIDHAENFVQYLPRARTYHSKSKGDNNLNSFRRGEIQFLLTVNKCNEGIDIPDAEVVVFLRCTDSKTVFYQQLGRGLRKSIGKEKVIVLDFVANLQRLQYLKEFADRMTTLNGNRNELYREVLKISGHGFDFIFSDEQIEILDVIQSLRPKMISDYPDLLLEYSTKNILPPDQVSFGSHKKVLWECSDCSHEWREQVHDRMRLADPTRGCPICHNRTMGKVKKKPNGKLYLWTEYPELAEEYDEKLNSLDIKNSELRDCWSQRFWWNCKECKAQYWATLNERIRRRGIDGQCIKCPICHGTGIQKKSEKLNERRFYFLTDAFDTAAYAGCRDMQCYARLCEKDPKLPSVPDDFYDVTIGGGIRMPFLSVVLEKIKSIERIGM